VTFREAVDQFGLDEACKVTVEPFITANEFVAEAEAGHESALIEPEYHTERSQEENAFDSGKCNNLFGEACIGRITPFKSPFGLVLNTWYCYNGTKEVQFFHWVFDVRVNEEGVHFAVDVFYHNLEAVEAAERASGVVISVAKLLHRFLLTLPSEVAKNART